MVPPAEPFNPDGLYPCPAFSSAEAAQAAVNNNTGEVWHGA
jgi:hypothetical protein